MACLTVIYRTPSDPRAFREHYFTVHVPLTRQLPGLLDYQVSDGPIVQPHGGQATFFVATLYFENLDAIRSVFASPVGRACAADRAVLAPRPGDALMMLYETRSAD